MSISKIIWNIAFLVKKTSVDDIFLSGLVEKGLITDAVVEDLKNRKGGINSPRFAYLVFEEVDKKGKIALDQLVDVLLKTGNIDAATLLDPRKVERKAEYVKQNGEFIAPEKSLSVKVVPTSELYNSKNDSNEDNKVSESNTNDPKADKNTGDQFIQQTVIHAFSLDFPLCINEAISFYLNLNV